MAAAEQRCPHCLRAFKRLRAHLPHCKAAPSTASEPKPTPKPRPGTQTPGSGSGTGRALPAGKARGAAASEGSGKEKASGGIRRQHGAHGAEPAVRDVSEWLDLSPEEVTGVAEQLRSGAQIVIRNHRARVLREDGGSRSPRGSPTGRQKQSAYGSSVAGPDPSGTDPARAEPREGKLGPGTAKREPRSSGAAGTKGGKGRAKAPGGPCGSSPREPPRREGGDRAGAEQQLPGVGVGCDPPNLLPAAEPPRGHPKGTPGSDPRDTQKLRGGGKEAAATAQPSPEGRRDPGLALSQPLLLPSQNQPICAAPAKGLEWFPDLYPNYRGLRLFPGKLFQEDSRIPVRALKGDSSRGQPGFLSAQLPAWLPTRELSPQGLLGGAQRAWSSFSSRYLQVKRGSLAGVSVLLAGSCLLTSCWQSQHTKHHHWHRYH